MVLTDSGGDERNTTLKTQKTQVDKEANCIVDIYCEWTYNAIWIVGVYCDSVYYANSCITCIVGV
jgi:hypothetical protein